MPESGHMVSSNQAQTLETEYIEQFKLDTTEDDDCKLHVMNDQYDDIDSLETKSHGHSGRT